MQGSNEDLEVNLEEFTNKYILSLNNLTSLEEEDELIEIAGLCMQSNELDEENRDFFQSAFLIMSKRKKKFINLKEMNRMIKSGQLNN